MINHFLTNLRNYRKQRNMTQQDLANRLYISRQTISAYETEIRHCDLDTLVRLSEILEVTLDELIL